MIRITKCPSNATDRTPFHGGLSRQFPPKATIFRFPVTLVSSWRPPMVRTLLFTGIFLYTSVLIAQNHANLTARELFYAPPAKKQPAKISPPAAERSGQVAHRAAPRKVQPKPLEL